MITLADESGKVVARLSDPGADWKFLDDEFQRHFETLLIEGVGVLGGEPKILNEDTEEEVIGDSYVVLMPGSEGFAEAFWEVLQSEYDLIES